MLPSVGVTGTQLTLTCSMVAIPATALRPSISDRHGSRQGYILGVNIFIYSCFKTQLEVIDSVATN